MAYKVLVQVSEDGDWDPVLDMKLSRTRSVPRLFLDEDAAQYYIDQQPKQEEGNYNRKFKIEEAEELEDVG
jgi:hypothetical protein